MAFLRAATLALLLAGQTNCIQNEHGWTVGALVPRVGSNRSIQPLAFNALPKETTAVSDLKFGNEVETWEAYYHFFGVATMILVGTLVLLPAYGATHEVIERYTSFSHRHAIILTFMVLLTTSDISQRSAAAKGNQYEFNPAAAIIIIESVKFLISSGLFGVVAAKSNPRTKIDLPSRYDFFLLQAPAFVFFIHNLLMLKAIEQCSLATYTILRETRVVFTALLWMAVFQVRLGCVRMTAVVGILVGFTVNKAHGGFLGHDTAWGIFFGLMSGLSSAGGGVLCEFAMKYKASVDINLQNMILYAGGVVYGIIYMALVKPDGLRSPSAFFAGFGPPCLQIIALDSVLGLTNSRILKYVDSVTKTIAGACCIPITVYIGALCLKTKLEWYEVASSFVVLCAVCAYVSQGPLRREEPKSIGKPEASQEGGGKPQSPQEEEPKSVGKAAAAA